MDFFNIEEKRWERSVIICSLSNDQLLWQHCVAGVRWYIWKGEDRRTGKPSLGIVTRKSTSRIATKFIVTIPIVKKNEYAFISESARARMLVRGCCVSCANVVNPFGISNFTYIICTPGTHQTSESAGISHRIDFLWDIRLQLWLSHHDL